MRSVVTLGVVVQHFTGDGVDVAAVLVAAGGELQFVDGNAVVQIELTVLPTDVGRGYA